METNEIEDLMEELETYIGLFNIEEEASLITLVNEHKKAIAKYKTCLQFMTSKPPRRFKKITKKLSKIQNKINKEIGSDMTLEALEKDMEEKYGKEEI